MSEILCVILARGGSKGIPKKNIKLIANKPLIAWTINAAKKSNIFDHIVVSTDSEEIAEVAKEFGADVPFMRPNELAQDHIWSRDALKHAVLECEKIYKKKYKFIFELPCVAPLRTEKHILEAYKMLKTIDCTSVTSVTQMQDKHPVRMKRIVNNTLTDFCKEFPEGEGSRRQDLELCYIRNGAIYSMTRDCIVENFSRHGEKCVPYIMDEKASVNIDTIMDFKLAEIMLKEKLLNTSKKRIKIEAPTYFVNKNILNNNFFEIVNDDPEILIVNPGTKHKINETYLSQFKNLKVVGTPSTGINHLDMNYLNKNKIKVFCLLDDRETLNNIQASAEFTWLHIMNGYRKFNLATKKLSNWRSLENEQLLQTKELYGKTIGIIGLGRIGKKIKKYAKVFGMNVLYYDPYVEGFMGKVNSIQELKNVDILSINCYLTNETENLISDGILDNFKDGLVVINTSRGEIVDEDYIEKLINNCEN